MIKMIATVILNPKAKGGKCKKLWEKSIHYFDNLKTNITLEVLETQYSGHGIELAKNATENSDILIAFGGDGTVNECINGILQSKYPKPLHIMPVGTGNDIALTNNLTKNIIESVNLLDHYKIVPTDVGYLKNYSRYFAGVASTGFDAEVTKAVNEGHKIFGGTLNYLSAAIKNLIKLKASKVAITIFDENEKEIDFIEEKAVLLAVGVGQYYGGGMRIVPSADVHDGKFHMVFAKEISKFQVLRVLPKVYKGNHITHPAVRVIEGVNIRIESEDNLLLQCDGEIIGNLPETFISKHDALQIIHPSL